MESYTDRVEAHLVQDPQPDRLKMEHTCLEQANNTNFAWIQIQVSGDTVQSHQPGLVQDTANGGKPPAATNLICKPMMFYQVKLALRQGCMFKLPQKWDDLPSPTSPSFLIHLSLQLMMRGAHPSPAWLAISLPNGSCLIFPFMDLLWD